MGGKWTKNKNVKRGFFAEVKYKLFILSLKLFLFFAEESCYLAGSEICMDVQYE